MRASVRRGRRKGHTLYAALLACVGVPELEESARDVLTPLVLREDLEAKRIGSALGVSARSARRLLSAYGWTRVQAPRLAKASRRESMQMSEPSRLCREA